MNIESAFRETENETVKILEFYTQYLKDKRPDYNFELFQTPRFYDYDAIVTLDGVRKLHIEVKVRQKVYLNQYQETKIPIRKHAVALFFMQNHEIRTKYLCLFSDGLFSLNLHEDPDNIMNMPSRWDRGGYICEYAMYNVARFKRLGYD